MFELVLLLCFPFGLTAGQIFEGQKLNLCNATNSGKQWLSMNTANLQILETQNTNDSESAPPQGMEAIPADVSSWANFPVLPLIFASSNTLPEGRCKEQARRYLQNLANSTLWAVQMFDASTKFPDGLIYGHTKYLGNFDQCYNLHAKLPHDEGDSEYEDEIEGRYCLIRFNYQRKDVVSPRPQYLPHDFDPNLSVWEAIDYRGDFRRVKRHSIYMALCVPASCSVEDVSTAITEPLAKFAEARGIRLQTRIKPFFCQARSDDPKNLSTGTKVFCFIITALFVLVLGSSWYDSSFYSAEEVATENGPRDFFLCFSVRRNFHSIFATSGSHPGLECIHLIRFVFMGCTIIGHRMMQYCGFPMVNANYFEKSYSAVPYSTVLFNGSIIVDGFFGLGALLLAYGILEELDRSKRIRFTALILVRFLRLTPLYMFVVFFNATLMPLLGSGPYWKAKVAVDSENCAKNWWTNLLYINNYVKTDEICMFQSWYLSVDYHLYIMGLFVLYVFSQLPRKLGYLFLGGLIAVGIAIPCVDTYVKDTQPIFLGLPFMGNVRTDPYYVEHYVKSHNRIASYMIGILSGVIIYDHKGATWRLPKPMSWFLFILLSVCLTIASQSFGGKYFDPNSVVHPLVTAAYAGFHRAAFALGICSIVVLITVGDGLEWAQKSLTPRWAPPLARLTYGVYAIHNLNQSYEIGTTRSARVFSLHNCFWDFVPDMVYSFSLSLLLSVAIEGPIRKIEKLIFSKKPSRKTTEGLPPNTMKKTE